MAEPIKISELPIVGDVSTSAMIPMSQTGADGLATYKATAADLSKALMSDFVYSDLETDSKNAIGAINESARKVNALQSIVDGIKVEFQQNHAEGDFTFKSGVIGTVLQGLQGNSQKTKNLVNINTALENTSNSVSIDGNDITVTTKIDGTFRGSEIRDVRLKRNTQYTIRATVKEVQTCGEIGVRYWDGSTYVSQLHTATNRITAPGVVEKTFTTRNDSDMYQIYLFSTWDVSASGRTTYSNVQLEEGTTPTEYEPYFDGLKDSAVTKFTVNSKNLLKSILGTTTQNGVTCTANSDGTYTLNGTATATTYFHITGDLINKYKGLKLVGCPTGGSTNTYALYMQNRPATDYNFDYGNGIVINHNNDLTVEVNIYINNGYTCNNLVFKPMITEDLSATYADFVPYTETEYPIIFNGKSAGSVRDEVNLIGKKYIRRVGSIDLGTITDWAKITAPTGNIRFRSYAVRDLIKIPSTNSTPANMICSYYETRTASETYNNNIGISIQNTGEIYIHDPNFTDANVFKTAMSGVILNYELAEPVIEDITESEVMAVVNAGDSVDFDGDVPVGSDWNDLVFLKGV